MFYGAQWDKEDTVAAQSGMARGTKLNRALKKSDREKTHSARLQMALSAQLSKMKFNLSREEVFIEKSLPRSLQIQDMSTKFIAEIRSSHKWFGIMYHYSPHFPRRLRVLSLTTLVVTMLFMQAMLYPIAHPDDGSCADYRTGNECTAPSSSFGGGSECYWVLSAEHPSGACFFNAPGNSMEAVVFTALIALLLAVPLNVFTDYLIMSVLAAPTLSAAIAIDESNAGDVSPSQQQSPSACSAYSTDIEDGLRAATPTPGDLAGSQRNLVVSEMSAKGDNVKGKYLKSTLGEEEFLLTMKMEQYRREISMDTVRLEKFDELWGLNSQGRFRSKGDTMHYLDKARKVKADVRTAVVDDLRQVRVAAAKEIDYLSAPNVSNKIRGRRIMRWFQQDMMPGLSGKIMQSLANAEGTAPPAVPLWKKMLSWAIVLGLDATMLFYVFLFGLSQDNDQQDAWLKSFLFWVVMDVAVVATGIVFAKNIALPVFVMKEVHKVRDKLLEAVREGFRKSRQGETTTVGSDGAVGLYEGAEFNATHFFFVSARIVEKFPHLEESRIILNFSTPWPNKSYIHTRDVGSECITDKFSGLFMSAAMIAPVLADALIQLPPSVQDATLQVVFSTMCSYIVIAFPFLYRISLVVALALVVVLAILVHCTIMWCSSTAAGHLKDHSTKTVKRNEAEQQAEAVRMKTQQAAAAAAAEARFRDRQLSGISSAGGPATWAEVDESEGRDWTNLEKPPEWGPQEDAELRALSFEYVSEEEDWEGYLEEQSFSSHETEQLCIREGASAQIGEVEQSSGGVGDEKSFDLQLNADLSCNSGLSPTALVPPGDLASISENSSAVDCPARNMSSHSSRSSLSMGETSQEAERMVANLLNDF